MSSFSSRRLDNKVIIVTGSNSGIGRETALLFAKKGACVTLCGRDKERLEAVMTECQQLTGHPDRFIAVPGDLTDPSVRSRTVTDTIKTFGRLDILVGNAGEAPTAYDFLDETSEQFDKIVELVLKTNIFLIQQCIPHLEKSKGVIVLVSTIGAIQTPKVLYPYNIMKAALNQLVRILAISLGPKGIRVNGTCPGLTFTGIFRASDMDRIRAYVETCSDTLPLENRVATPQEQAEVLVFLASNESSYVNGEMILVDGMSHKVVPGYNEDYHCQDMVSSI